MYRRKKGNPYKGGPYQRGRTDSYWRRPRRPHHFKSSSGPEILEEAMTPLEIAEYHRGFDDIEAIGFHWNSIAKWAVEEKRRRCNRELAEH